MTLHFDTTEFTARQSTATKAVRDAGLDAMILFAPESPLWLTGYDTSGFAMFQAMVLTASGDIHLLTRMPDLRQARHRSTLPDDHIHIWPEYEGCNPATDLTRLLADLGITGPIGFESNTAGLIDHNGQRLRAAIPDLQDHSDLIRALRRVKSPAVIAMHRRAAAMSDEALDAALDVTHAGAFEGDILAVMQGAVFKGGGDYAGNEFITGSGEGALLCRYFSGRRHLDATDQLTLEWSGAYARYHAAMMRTVLTGTPSDTHKRMHAAAEALQACGYGMGAVYNPIWVDFPMFYEKNPLLMQQDQVFFLHIILMDSDVRAAMTLGHSVLVTDTGCERLSRHPLDLLVRQAPAPHIYVMLKFTPILLAILYGYAMYKLSAWQLARELNEKSTELADPKLRALTAEMVKAVGLPRIKVHIYEIEPVNGLAAPDGRIFITRGFYQKYQNGEVTAEEMASVIAHELGHVALGHSRRRMVDFSNQNALRTVMAMLLSRFIPGLGQIIANALMSLMMKRLSRSDEYEADAYASALMIKSGLGTGPQKSLFEKLPNLTGANGAAQPAWLLSHPKTPERIAAIEANEAKWGA